MLISNECPNLANPQTVFVTQMNQLTGGFVKLAHAMLQGSESRAWGRFPVIQLLVKYFQNRIAATNGSCTILAAVLSSDIFGNCQKPWAQGLVDIDLCQLSPQQQKYFLREIVSLKRVIDPYRNKCAHFRFMSRNDFFEGLQVTITGKRHWQVSMSTSDMTRRI